MNGQFFFQLEMKMSTSNGSISQESVDAHANYLFERDKVFKQKFDTANRIKRIVPEVSGKKKLRSDDNVSPQYRVEDSVEDDTQDSMQIVSNAVTDEPELDDNENLSILNYLKKQHENMSMAEKAACVNFLDDRRSSNIPIVLMLVLIAFVIGMCVGSKCNKFYMR